MFTVQKKKRFTHNTLFLYNNVKRFLFFMYTHEYYTRIYYYDNIIISSYLSLVIVHVYLYMYIQYKSPYITRHRASHLRPLLLCILLLYYRIVISF